MFLLRVFALGLLLAPATSAFAAPLMPSSAPTMEDVDPGIDNTGRDRDLAPELRRQSVEDIIFAKTQLSERREV